MKTEQRIEELDALFGRVAFGMIRISDRKALEDLIEREIKRLRRLVAVHEASKKRRLQLKAGILQ